MPSIEVLIAFGLATIGFAFLPGPAMLYAASQTVAKGRKSGLMAALGIHVGGYVHVVAAAAGLSVLFQAIPILYSIVKFGGACYLIWIGISFFRSPPQEAFEPQTISKTAWRSFAESIAVEVLNPKTALFFLAFLPPFVNPSAGFPLWMQISILGAVVNLTFTLADILSVLLAEVMLKRLRGAGTVQKRLRKIGGSVMIGLGVNLALQRN